MAKLKQPQVPASNQAEETALPDQGQTPQPMEPNQEPAPGPHENSRDESCQDCWERVVDETAANLAQEVEAHRQSRVRPLADGLWVRVEDCIMAVASNAEEMSKWQNWRLVERLDTLVAEVEALARPVLGKWWQLHFVPHQLLQKIESFLEAVQGRKHPPEREHIEDRPLEPLAELLEQKVGFDQIAKIYGWLLPNRQPDIEKVRLARQGKLEPPRSRRVKVKPDWPARCPHGGGIARMAEAIERRIQEEG